MYRRQKKKNLAVEDENEGKQTTKTVMDFKCVKENKFLKDLEPSRLWSKQM